MCDGLSIGVLMPEPGEETILDEGSFCDASQVHIRHLRWKWLCPSIEVTVT